MQGPGLCCTRPLASSPGQLLSAPMRAHSSPLHLARWPARSLETLRCHVQQKKAPTASRETTRRSKQQQPPASTSLPTVRPAPFTLTKRVVLAGGTLDLVYWEDSVVPGQPDRMLRIWTPPGFVAGDADRHGWPVLFLNDGQNLFDDKLCFSGSSWRAAEAAAALIASGDLPPFVIVGIDHRPHPYRSLDYTPYKPGTGPNGFRKDAADWPGGEVDAYLERVINEVMPFARRTYNVATNPELVAFGGSSFGGICAIAASMRHPGLFDSVLIESPSLWLAEEKFLWKDVIGHNGLWPTRIFIGMGGREFSGIRSKEDESQKNDDMVASYASALETLLLSQGVSSERIQTVVEPSATHNEFAWRKRLPSALKFLLSGWWQALASQRSNHLYFTFPQRLRAGQSAALLFNRQASSTLAQHKGGIKLTYGFNGWDHKGDQEMQPLPNAGSSSPWLLAHVMVPSHAYEMTFAFSDQQGKVWDSNGSANYYSRISLRSSAGGPEHHYQNLPDDDEVAEEAAVVTLEELFEKSRERQRLFFTYPERLEAGMHFQIYLNRRRSDVFRNSPNCKLTYGWNDWEDGAMNADLKPSSLWRGEHDDWWSVPLTVPENAENIKLCFTNGDGGYENNKGANYELRIKNLKKLSDPQQAQGPAIKPRGVEKEERLEHADGHLHVLTLSPRDTGDAARDRNSRWTEEKIVRVWTPPGYSKENAPEGGWPMLLINDAQNKFECWLAHQGVSWRIGYTASNLIREGKVPPFVIVGIDNPGPMRSLNYLPYPPGSGQGGFRGDAERWPGGGVDQYMHRVIYEILPLVQPRFNLTTDPARVAFGGGSFGGINALHVALNYSSIFGCVLAESPSLWIAEGRFLEDMWNHRGMLPERIFMACGTLEYSATRDHDRPDVDALLLHYYNEAARCLESKGLTAANGRLRYLVEEGAGHHELAWQWRLTGALHFLLGPWKS